MNIPCRNSPPICRTIPAGGPFAPSFGDNPVSNFSSEAPDIDLFIGNNWGVPWGDPDGPPLGSQWYQIGCLAFCVSSISQEDANLCAAAQADLCVTPWDGMPNIPDIPEDVPGGFPNTAQSCNAPCGSGPGATVTIPAGTYYAATQNEANILAANMACILATQNRLCANEAQSCDVACPDGLLFRYTVPAGTFFGRNQNQANQMALQYACARAQLLKLCFGSISPEESCVGQPYSCQIFVSSNSPPLTFENVTPLPAGIEIVQNSPQSFLITGTPTGTGNFLFAIRATDTRGNTMTKNFQLRIVGVANTSLPNGEVGTPYSATLTVAGPYTDIPIWSIIGGALPDGLSLDAVSGEISGTPTTAQGNFIVAQFIDTLVTCSKQLSITIDEVGCPGWNTMDWDTETLNTAGTGTAGGTYVAQDFEAEVNSPAGTIDGTENFAALSNTTLPPGLVYNGPGCDGNLHIEFTKVAGNQSQLGGSGILVFQQQGSLILASFPVTSADGVYDIPFSVADTLGADVNLFVIIDLQAGIDPGVLALANMHVIGFVENV